MGSEALLNEFIQLIIVMLKYQYQISGVRGINMLLGHICVFDDRRQLFAQALGVDVAYMVSLSGSMI